MEQTDILYMEQTDTLYMEQTNILYMEQTDILYMEQTDILYMEQTDILYMKQTDILYMKQTDILHMKETDISGTVQRTFMIMSPSVLLRMGNVSENILYRKSNHTFCVQQLFFSFLFSEYRAVDEIMWKIL